MERKLASVQRILDIEPIEGADRIEVATVLGWQCVVGKNQFKVNELVVYLEVDSITPMKSEFDLLKDSGYRVKTKKFRKQVSQGLCLPLSILPHDEFYDYPQCAYKEGDDVTELLGITKYEPYTPAQLAGEVKGNFPNFLYKSDETRIQAVPDILVRHKDKKFYISEKCDGSSFTCYLNNNEFGVCSRNLELRETTSNSYWKVARELDLESKLKLYGYNLGLQGELIGQGVQGNKYKLSNLQLKLFSIFDIDKREYLCYAEFIRVAKLLGIDTVPIVSDSFILFETVDELVEFAKGKSLLNKDTHREGLVFRPLVEEYDEELRGRLSFKVINVDFLLANKDS